MQQDKICFSVKVGKSHKNHGWAITRESAIELIPELAYEDECDIIVDGIPAKAHLNIQPRIFYNNDEYILIEHLKELADGNPDDRIEIEMLLNHEDNDLKENRSIDNLIIDINQLQYINESKDIEINKLKEYIHILKVENEKFYKEILLLSQKNEKQKVKLEKLSEILNESL